MIMALTGLHTDWEYGSYFNDRDWFIKVKENAPLANGDLSGLHPHFDGRMDGRGSIAIGYGFDLLVNDNTTINNSLTAANGQPTTLTAADITLLTEVRVRRAAGTATADYLRDVASQLSVSLVSEPAATTLLDLKLTQYETALDAALGGHSQLDNSKERIAVLSLIYTMVDPDGTKIANKIPSTRAAIINDNRAEAWYQIRYNSNPNGIHATRRYQEANLFGLYDTDFSNVKEAEAKEIMRMYTIHETKITSYEGQYSRPAGVPSINDDKGIGASKNYLIANFANGNTINGKVIVGAGLDSYAYLGENINDPESKLTGTENNDLIFGEKGNDTLNGAGGTDVMIGGIGDDTYKVDDTDDKIVEKDGEGKDLVQSTATYTLPNYVEDLTLMGTENINGTGNELPNEIKGNKGNNRLEGGGGNDKFDGGAENDTIWGGSGNDEINGGSGNDELYGNGGEDKFDGGAGNDKIYGGGGNDTLYGGGGKDTFYSEGGNKDTLLIALAKTIYNGKRQNLTPVDFETLRGAA
jgi:Ca2+-binding RTX toxin-like protein